MRPLPPLIPKKESRFVEFGNQRVDPYFWLKEKENPEVLQILERENAYVDAVLAPVKTLRTEILEELKARLEPQETGVPERDGLYEYSWKIPEGQQYRAYYRTLRDSPTSTELLLDLNSEVTTPSAYLSLETFSPSPDHRWLAYSLDRDGSEHYTLFFKNLTTGAVLNTSIPHTSSGFAWASDSRTVFFTRLNDQDRPYQVWRHEIQSGERSDPRQNDALVFEESDGRFYVGVANSQSRKYILIETAGKITSEVHVLSADEPAARLRVIEPRREGIEYTAEHHGDYFVILTNDQEKNFRAVRAPVTDPGAQNWREFRRGSPEHFIEGIQIFQNHWVFSERLRGLPVLTVLDPQTLNDFYTIDFEDPTYSLTVHGNREFNSTTLRFTYTSLKRPASTFDYDLTTRTRTLRKQAKIPGGFDPDAYEVRRLSAPSHDGVEAPLSVIWKKGLTFPASTLLYGYGSYGYSMDAGFSRNILSLVDRGFIYAIAHVRGGSDLGRHWYEDGKFLKKKNTFLDFIACAEKLIADGLAQTGDISIMGGSAGGMLVGAAMNLRPELFKTVVGRVPFVDVINTMLDETLPLTQTEYDEWGNPKNEIYYRYILSYSPYDNTERKAYPAVLFTAGLNDPRVTYWEPLKMVARLRDCNTADTPILLFTEMGAGHGGASGRFDRLKEDAMVFAFIVTQHRQRGP